MKDKINAVQKLYKTTSKEMENGDLKSFRRDIALLEAAVTEETRILRDMKALEADFNARAYFVRR